MSKIIEANSIQFPTFDNITRQTTFSKLSTENISNSTPRIIKTKINKTKVIKLKAYKKSLENYFFQNQCHPNIKKVQENQFACSSKIIQKQQSHDHWNSNIPRTNIEDQLLSLRTIPTPQSNIRLSSRQSAHSSIESIKII